jgi:processive 1,2-diacylglycerol beta-glucosyltransferase
MHCPNCGRPLETSQTICPGCGESRVAADAPDPDVTLESVFETTDPAALPLATMTLEEQGIEYTVRREGSLDALRYPAGALDLARSDATHEILVRREDAARARDLLDDLGALAAPSGDEAAKPSPTVVDLETGFTIGAITSEQAQFLIDTLEESTPDKPRYYIDASTIEMLENSGGDPEMISLLKRALGTRDGMEIGF